MCWDDVMCCDAMCCDVMMVFSLATEASLGFVWFENLINDSSEKFTIIFMYICTAYFSIININSSASINNTMLILNCFVVTFLKSIYNITFVMFVEMLYYNSSSFNFLDCNFFVSFFNQFYCMMKSMKVCCMIDVLLTFFFFSINF